MKSLFLSLVLGVASLGLLGLAPSQAQAWWQTRSYYPAYSYYYPSYSYYPSYGYAAPAYSYYYGPRATYSYPAYSYSYYPGYATYYYYPY